MDFIVSLLLILLTAPFEILFFYAISRRGSRDELPLAHDAKSGRSEIRLRLSPLLARSQNVRCTFCKNKFECTDILLCCVRCNATHHADCWNTNGSCGVFGCASKKARNITEVRFTVEGTPNISLHGTAPAPPQAHAACNRFTYFISPQR